MNFSLPPVGARINWFGSIYEVVEHTNLDKEIVYVLLGNGEKIPLWWRGTLEIKNNIYYQVPLKLKCTCSADLCY